MSITVEELDSLCIAAFKQDAKVDEVEAVAKEERKKLAELNAKLLAIFESGDKEKYVLKDFGTVSIVNRFTVTTPKGEQKAIFFDFLKQKGLFEDMATVHSATLNSWFQEEQKAELERGNVSWVCPGISEAKVVKSIRLTKGK